MAAQANKLALTRALVAEAREAYGDSVIVGHSGGKDALATLAVLADAFEHKHCFYLYLVNGLEFIEEHVYRTAEMFGATVTKLPHQGLPALLRTAVYMPHYDTVGAKARNVSYRDIERVMRARTGAELVAYGERQSDSMQRRMTQRRWGQLNRLHHRLFPVGHWSSAEVYAFLRHRRVPMPRRLSSATGHMSGFNLTGPCLLEVKRLYPRDYARILEVFPFAEAAVFREERRGVAFSEVRSAAPAADIDPQCAVQPAQDRSLRAREAP